MISLSCSKCRRQLQVQDEFAGQFLTCPSCRAVLPVPLADITADVPAPAVTIPLAAAEVPSPFAHLDETGGRAVISARVKERAYALYGREALGLGIAALVMMFLPCINLASGPIAILGLVLSIKGIIQCQSRSQLGLAFSIVGVVLNGLVCISWNLVLFSAILGAVS